MATSDRDYIDPDGVKLVWDWRKFEVGSVLFLPCADVVKAKRQFRKLTAHSAMRFRYQSAIKDGYMGLYVKRQK